MEIILLCSLAGIGLLMGAFYLILLDPKPRLMDRMVKRAMLNRHPRMSILLLLRFQ